MGNALAGWNTCFTRIGSSYHIRGSPGPLIKRKAKRQQNESNGSQPDAQEHFSTLIREEQEDVTTETESAGSRTSRVSRRRPSFAPQLVRRASSAASDQDTQQRDSEEDQHDMVSMRVSVCVPKAAQDVVPLRRVANMFSLELFTSRGLFPSMASGS